MKQVLQSLHTGATDVVDVPCPAPKAAHVLIRTRASLVSAGTERMVLAFGKGSWLSKARQQPEKVRQALHKIRTDGLFPTLEAIRSRLDRPVPMGYCNVGVALDTGRGVADVRRGDRVVSNGPHAEVVSVPQTLCAHVPERVSDESAAFTVMGAIALQGIRLAEPTLGETFAVTGLGLVGLLAVQLLRANGCRAIGLDFNPRRLALARMFGAETIDLAAVSDPVSAVQSLTRRRGVDGALVCTATGSHDPMRQAAHMCRKRGRIVLVGVAGLELARADFYEKELSFQVSCSYGPGRYDPGYEQQARDYPLPFVRWTEQRNFEAVLDLLAARRLDVSPLITHRYPLERAAEAYSLLLSPEPSLGVLLKYPSRETVGDVSLRTRTVSLNGAPLAITRAAALGSLGAEANGRTSTRTQRSSSIGEAPAIGMIGAGNFATRVLVPAFRKAGARLVCIASEGGLSAVAPGRRHGFDEATTDIDHILSHPQIDAVVIATRHDSHADLVARSLAAGKHAFVEKPLAIDEQQLASLRKARSALLAACSAPLDLPLRKGGQGGSGGAVVPASSSASTAPQEGGTSLLMVGFNRRFAPHTETIRELLSNVAAPKTFVMTVNAGAIPAEHWTQSADIGGGRIIGEACHFLDLLRHLCGHSIVAVNAVALPCSSAGATDTATITLRFADGSHGTIHYFANGHSAFPKERLEIFAAGRVLQLDNFRRLNGCGWPKFRRHNLWRQDKGHNAGVQRFVDAIRNGSPSPIPWHESIEVTRATFAAVESINTGNPVELSEVRDAGSPIEPVVSEPPAGNRPDCKAA